LVLSEKEILKELQKQKIKIERDSFLSLESSDLARGDKLPATFVPIPSSPFCLPSSHVR
jgi:hypothetical protein